MGVEETLWAFATATIVFGLLLIAALSAVAVMTAAALRPIRMSGPAVKRWGGFVLIGVGTWFVVLAALPSPILVA